MKAGIFDPYLDTVGGGERYAMTVAEALLEKGWRVDVFWPDKTVRVKLKEKFFLDIDRVSFVSYSPRLNNLFNRWNMERNYDFLFYLSDGSIPFMFSRNNVLHFQVPFKNVLRKSLKNSLKLKTIKAVVCNSLFTKAVIDKCLGIKSIVIYPPVDVEAFTPLKKENIILSVGRFSQLLQGKKQDVLVDVFKELIGGGLSGWKLVLAGGSEVGGSDYLKNLINSVKGFPIEIIENPPFSELTRLYSKAKFFWTASGYGIDEETEPERVEHFGITTVEAMAAGCVPIVQGKGGQKEIIEEGKSGFMWLSKEELIMATKKIIKDKELLEKVSANAVKRSGDFSKEKFYEKIYNLTS